MKNIILIFLILINLVCACSKDKDPDMQIPEGELPVEMNLLAPGISTTEENVQEVAIHDLLLLVFNGSGENATFEYSRYAWKKSDSGNTFTTTLKTGTDLTIYFVANAASLINDLPENVLVKDKAWSEIKEHLILDTPEQTGKQMATKGLPMWGNISGQTITEQPNVHLGSIQLLRSVASIDIQLICSNFDLQKGYIAYAANKGYLPYNPDKTVTENGILKASTPWSPGGFTTDIDLEHTVNNGDLSIKNIFYVYENETSLTPELNSFNRPTKVVLQGVWKDSGSSGKSTYYPLSLRYQEKTNKYVKKQAIRNNKFSIIITHVNGDGYDNYEDAKLADDVNMDYDVIEWNENEDGDIYIDGSKYISLTSRYAKLARDNESTAEITFRTNFSADEIKMKFPSDTEYTESDSIDTHPRFKVDIQTGQEDDDTKNCFKITTKQRYGKADNPAVLSVTAGRIEFTLTMEQFDKNPSDWVEGPGIGVGVGE